MSSQSVSPFQTWCLSRGSPSTTKDHVSVLTSSDDPVRFFRSTFSTKTWRWSPHPRQTESLPRPSPVKSPRVPFPCFGPFSVLSTHGHSYDYRRFPPPPESCSPASLSQTKNALHLLLPSKNSFFIILILRKILVRPFPHLLPRFVIKV